ncbi:MFS transporter [Streptomyces aurantiogriseus]|uniref:MFS transporter n=1 Tax=Streptomyces aurantiogriseus TaxID=66870 RepID=A0A918KXR1_9ACTN|nr:MFS transporter [Streptomyces aurantiogriseus]GGR41651.1 MFS transporter [Streptomyces aurantiogriseus]
MNGRGGRGAALLVAGAFFMENLDATIISTAAPEMAASFGARPEAVGVTVTAYVVALAVFIPLSGWAAGRWGTRRVFAAAIAVFTVASALCAAADGLTELVLTRVLQGIGGAMMVPVGRLAVLRTTRRRDLLRAIAWLTWPGLLAPVLAPALGGLFTTYASWRWIFLVNVPLGVVALPAALWLIPDLRREDGEERRGLDRVGFVLVGSGLAALVLGLELLGGSPARWCTAALWLGAGLLTCGLAVRHLRLSPRPLLDLATFRVTTFRVSNAGGALFRAAVSVPPFLLPLMFQQALGWSAARAGLVLTAVFAGNIAVKPFTTPLLRRFGFRTVLVVNGAATAVTFALCGMLGPRSPLPVVVAVLFVSGVCRSVSLSAYATIGFADIEPERTADANSLSSAVQQLATGLGVALATLSLGAAGPLASLLGLDGPTAAYAVAFGLLTVLPLMCVAEASRLRRDAGAMVTGAVPARAGRPPAPSSGSARPAR